MAIVSTANSLLCSITTNLSSDFFTSGSLKSVKFINLIVGVAAGIFSLIAHDILAILIFAYEISVILLFVPLTMSVIFKQPSTFAAYASIAFSFVSFIICKLHSISVCDELMIMMLSSFVFLFIQFYSIQLKKEQLT
jgi:hypothetical protein